MLRVVELYSGYGSQSIALNNLGIEHEVVAISDIDTDAIIAYAAIRGLDTTQYVSLESMQKYLINIGCCRDTKTDKIKKLNKQKTILLYNACKIYNNLGDVRYINPDEVPDCDMITYSFPCQDISVAGHQKGFSKDSKTRSGTLWNCTSIISKKKPKYLLMENVKNLLSKKMISEFNKWLEYLESEGYTNYYKVLNAKDYGIPQNRERVFMISILGEHTPYEFPEPFESNKRLRDVLEEQVDNKYYVSEDKLNRLINSLDLNKLSTHNKIQIIGSLKEREDSIGQRSTVYSDSGIVGALTATDYKEPKYIANVSNSNLSEIIFGSMQEHKAIKLDGISPTLTSAMGEGGGHIPMIMPILTPDRINKRQNGRRFKNNDEESFTITATDRHGILMIGSVNKKGISSQAGRVYNPDGISPTLNTMQGGDLQPFILEDNDYIEIKVRKLTPLECFRLMGMKDKDFYSCKEIGLSNSALYKLAGNSIVVDVLEHIFANLFK